jgi:UTP:GlnB (protein PII) uridylyltransferase
VVARDRPGLLGNLAAVLADHRLSITTAAATVLPAHGIALQRVTAVHADGRSMAEEDWEEVGCRLQAVLGRREGAPHPGFVPAAPVTVVAQPQDLGRALVSVEAPDRVGLLWAVASWFADHGCNVEAYQATSSSGTANDKFLVAGDCDWTALAEAISGAPVETQRLPAPLERTVRVGLMVAAVAGATASRVVRALRRPT